MKRVARIYKLDPKQKEKYDIPFKIFKNYKEGKLDNVDAQLTKRTIQELVRSADTMDEGQVLDQIIKCIMYF